jgi:hypothetical protein
MSMHIKPSAAARIALAIALAAVATTLPAQDARRPDGSVIRPITTPEPTPRSGYDPNAPARQEQDAARRAREEENARRIQDSRDQREAQMEETLRRRGASGTPASSIDSINEQRSQQLERARREREAAADSPARRQQ